MNIEVLYQDEDIIVINKPSGLLSVPFEGFRGKTAQSQIEEILRRRGMLNRARHPLAVHRLDRDTSGVMMFSLNERSQKKLMDNWQKIVTERWYIAVAENPKENPRNPAKILGDEGCIDKPISFNSKNHSGYVAKNASNSNKVDNKNRDQNKSVSAVTHYKILERGKCYTLFQLELETGRKNQIRAHLASVGYPLAGDENYGAKTDPFGRLALHARTLEFIHPSTGEKMKFEVEEPKEWAKLVKNAPGNMSGRKFSK